MGFYGKDITIDGVVCGTLMRGVASGEYLAVFEREHASLEQIEAINWERPEVKCRRDADKLLPAGCGFQVRKISYDSGVRAFTVTVQVKEQYLGDVSGYQAQIETLADQADAARAEADSVRQQMLDRETDLAAAYEEGVEKIG